MTEEVKKVEKETPTEEVNKPAPAPAAGVTEKTTTEPDEELVEEETGEEKEAKPAKVVLADMEDFKACISILSELISEANIVLNEEGFSIVAMDPANVAMVIYKAPPSAFTLYDVPEANESCVNLGNFKQFLKRSSKDTILELTFTEKLNIKMTTGNKIKTFTLPVLDIEESKTQKIPELKHAATVTMETAEFSDLLLDADIVAESIIFNVEPAGMVVTSQGDLSTYRNNVECSIDCKEACNSKYSLEYLKKMVNTKIAKKVSMKVATEYPLMLEYETATAGKLTYILAPRVEND